MENLEGSPIAECDEAQENPGQLDNKDDRHKN